MSQPPYLLTPAFNPFYFNSSTDLLTLQIADQRYLSLGGGNISGNLFISGACDVGSLTIGGATITAPPTYVLGVTPGTAALSKALVLDGSGNISGINSLSAANLTGTLQTAAQPNITSVGTLTTLNCSGNVSGTLITPAQPNITSLGTLTGLTVCGNISGTLSTAAQPNITSVGTLTGLTVSGNISGTLSTAAQPNITSVGTLTGLSVSGTISGTLSTAAQPNITALGTLTSLTLSGAISGATTIGASGIVTMSNTTVSTSNITGALVISGGLGIAKNITIGGTAAAYYPSWGTTGIQYASTPTTYNINSSGTIASAVVTSFAQPQIGGFSSTVVTNVATVYIDNSPAPGTAMTFTNAYSLWINSGNVLIGDTTASSSSTTGALVVSGGVGIGGSFNLAGSISGATTISASGVVSLSNTTFSTSPNFGALTCAGGIGCSGPTLVHYFSLHVALRV